MAKDKEERWNIEKIYDPTTGEFIRKMRTIDIVSLSAQTKSGTLIASTIGMTSYQMFPYIFREDNTSTADSLVLIKNTSTIAIVGGEHGRHPQIVVDPDLNPLCRIAAADTVKIKPLDGATGTFAATLLMKRVPINTKVNTG